ncbi:TonB-dependent receptor [Phenylobacterium deserti]|uniref:TonB-dependent receptor n=1 Tax=Phenylobacterium deserti TaxID=1914756 RepID=UPI001403DDAA
MEAVWYHDLIARYRFDDVGQGAEVYLGVNNIFDETIPNGLVGNTSTSAGYDIFGRYLFAGFRTRF